MPSRTKKFSKSAWTQRFEVCWKMIPRLWSSNGKRPLPELEESPRCDKVPLHSITKRWPRWNIGDGSQEVFHIQWRWTDDRLVDKQAQFVLDLLSNRQPWSSLSADVTWSRGRRPNTSRAAAWRTRCIGASTCTYVVAGKPASTALQ